MKLKMYGLSVWPYITKMSTYIHVNSVAVSELQLLP